MEFVGRCSFNTRGKFSPNIFRMYRITLFTLAVWFWLSYDIVHDNLLIGSIVVSRIPIGQKLHFLRQPIGKW